MNPEDLTIEVVPECGHGVAGRWNTLHDKGALCWMFHKGTPAVRVPWPEELLCRNCGKSFERTNLRKRWIQPGYYSDKERTFNCGCIPFDTSD